MGDTVQTQSVHSCSASSRTRVSGLQGSAHAGAIMHTCMAALESPPAARKSVTGSKPWKCSPRAVWKARMTLASDTGSGAGAPRPVSAVSDARLLG